MATALPPQLKELDLLTANRTGSKAQARTLGGRKYLVCPVVMIKQGVLSGNNGPILYTNAVVSKKVQRWNGVPLTLGHPEDDNGNKISGRDPESADKYQIGVVYNARYTGDRLKGEAWFDVERLDSLAPGLQKKLEKGERIELSTGLYTYAINKKGMHKGRPYTHLLRNYEPDHLAVLLKEPGACSLNDGCGVNVNSKHETDLEEEEQHQELYCCGASVTVNSMSDTDVRAGLTKLLIETDQGTGSGGLRSSAHIQDVFPAHFTYRQNGQVYKQEYTRSQDTLTLKGSPVEVIESRTYKPVKRTTRQIQFQSTVNAGASCGIGPGGFQPGNSCAKGGRGRRGKGKARFAKGLDPTVDKDGDGVTDAARVGIAAFDVSPPPRIPRLPGLTRKERAVERAFASAYERNPDKVAGDFRKLVSSTTKPGEPKVFGTDDAKALTSAWSSDGMSLEQRSVNRATLNTALHQTANAVAKRAFVQELDSLSPGDEVMVTVGGCGAGKGYALKNVPQALAMKKKSKVVWDSAGDQNATENPWIQQEAEKRGLKVNYVYVHADPRTQWAHPERGVVKRAGDPNDGRMVDAKVFADSYAYGARNHQAFYDKQKSNPNANFIFLENAGKPRRLNGIPKSSLNIDSAELASYAMDVVMKSDAPAHVKAGATIGSRIWRD